MIGHVVARADEPATASDGIARTDALWRIRSSDDTTFDSGRLARLADEDATDNAGRRSVTTCGAVERGSSKHTPDLRQELRHTDLSGHRCPSCFCWMDGAEPRDAAGQCLACSPDDDEPGPDAQVVTFHRPGDPDR